MKLKKCLFAVGLLAFLTVDRNQGAQEHNDDRPKMAEETVKAWTEAKAEFGQVQLGSLGNLIFFGWTKPGDFQFFPARPEDWGYGMSWAKPGDMPAFQFSAADRDPRHQYREGVIAKLPAPKEAFGLSLKYCQVTDKGLKELAGLQNLQALDLSGNPISDKGLKELAGLKSLRTLILSFTQVTDAGLKELAGLTNLQALNLDGCAITDSGLKELAGLKNLQVLNLGLYRVTDKGLKDLAGLKNLQRLFLNNAQITDAWLKELAGLNDLQLLDLGNNQQVTGAGLKDLAGLKKLRELRLMAARVTDQGLKGLAGLDSLQVLDLWGAKITDAGLMHLAGLKDLKILILFDTLVTGTGLKELAGLENLHLLDLRKAPVTDAGLKELAGLQSLKTLDLAGNKQITDAGVKELAALKTLKVLALQDTPLVTDTAIQDLGKALPGCNIVRAEDPAHNELRALLKDVLAAYHAGNLDKLMTYLDDHAVVTWQNGHVTKNPKEFKEFFEAMTKGPGRIVQKSTIDPKFEALALLFNDTKTAVVYGESKDHYDMTNGMQFDQATRWSATVIKKNGRWKLASMHISANQLDNPVLNISVKRTAFWSGGIAAGVGLILGIVVGAVYFGRRAKPAGPGPISPAP